MRTVLDTNVLVSRIFFAAYLAEPSTLGPTADSNSSSTPHSSMSTSASARGSASRGPLLEYEAVLAAIAGHGVLVADTTWDGPITVDPDDDKFMLCARSADAVVVSGDSDLLDVSGWEGIDVLTPRDLLNRLGDSAAI